MVRNEAEDTARRKPNSLRSQSNLIVTPIVAKIEATTVGEEKEHEATFSDFCKSSEPMSREQEFELIARVRMGDASAKEEICERSKRLVVKMVRNYIGRGIDFDDLVQEGMIGVLKALDKYDITHESGSRFSTYASYWIKREICDGINQHSRSIKIPAHVLNTYSKIGKAMKKLSQEYNRAPSVEEMSEYLEMPISRIEEVLNYMVPVESMDAPSLLVEEQTLGDMIKSDVNDTEERGVESIMMQQFDGHLKRILDDREYYIIVSHKGLFNHNSITLEEIGDHLCLTRERVRQLEMQAESKMKEDLKLRQFEKDFYAN